MVTPNKKISAFQEFLNEVGFYIAKKWRFSNHFQKIVNVLLKMICFPCPRYKTIEIRAEDEDGPMNYTESARVASFKDKKRQATKLKKKEK